MAHSADIPDQQSLEWQYNPRVSIPNASTYIKRAQQLSADTIAEHERRADIRYGPGSQETFDLYPAAACTAPVHVFFHGGYWRAQDKTDYAFVARDLTQCGINVVVANYDLCPTVTVTDIVTESVRCIRYVIDQAEALGVAADRLSVSGHSAGAQLVAKLLMHDWAGEGMTRYPLCAALAISGVYDLAPLIHTSINDAVRLTADSARENSPLLDPAPEADIPILLAVGGDETAAFHEQSRRYGEHLRRAGLRPSQIAPVGCNHMSVLEALFLYSGEYFEQLQAFI